MTILRAAVERSDEYSELNFIYGEAGEVSTAITFEDLKENKLDLMWTASSLKYEEEYRAIYVPIYRGTLGMRLGIVEQEKQHIMSGVANLQHLTKLVACQGKLWADTEILQANGIKVAASHKYPNLFPMLEGDRCDYFPRAIFEPWSEVEREHQYKLTVDTHVLIKYRLPYLYFVEKSNVALAQHLTEILNEMLADGSFEQLFFADKDVKKALSLSNLKSRQIIQLQNPFVSKNVNAIAKEWWFDPLSGNEQLVTATPASGSF